MNFLYYKLFFKNKNYKFKLKSKLAEPELPLAGSISISSFAKSKPMRWGISQLTMNM